uniref:72 kDa inositol polyphosphate 5-phosphatase n=1 Tax=Phallusia mammillata TaxID=59560 RepID=A0A6F9DFU7_9ASCI|nr:72 kDa inositol polyphosphate 5-phosphatase [Phallusia mammillata]
MSLDTVSTSDVGNEKSDSSATMGILSGIPSSSLRERNFLVGNVTTSNSKISDDLDNCFPERKVQIFVGTWNMQRCEVPLSIDDFLLPRAERFVRDVYVIGVQEATTDIKGWEIKLQETLGPNHVLIHSMSHGVLHMAIFIRRDLIWFCTDFQEDKITTRLISQVKTKGAIAISFQLFGTRFLFISSHFHSGETKVRERIEDYYKIMGQLHFLSKNSNSTTYQKCDKDFSGFDCVFWFGDLNFRINQPHHFMQQEVEDPSTYNIWEALKCDQLKRNMERGNVFHGFQETEITFLPTYKFTPGSDKYDVSVKLRVPSYTDRILHKPCRSTSITCHHYNSVSSVKHSDHRPVYGLFDVSLKPGRNSAPLGKISFNHEVYMAAAKRRANCVSVVPNSSVCTIL